MSSSGAGDADYDTSGESAAGGKPARRGLKRAGQAIAKPSRVGAAGRRAQRTVSDGVVAVRKEAAERAVDVARKAKEAALPRLSQARDGVRQRVVAVNPEVAEQVTFSLIAAVTLAAGKHSGKVPHPAVKVVGAAIGAVGPVMATHAAKQVRKGFEKSPLKARSAETADGPSQAGLVDWAEQAGEANTDSAQSTNAPSPVPEAMTPSEFADVLGVRQPPDPEALYRDGSSILEPVFPLPENLASIPWSSLSRRNRFFVLVAAWALREADGIQLLKAGQLEQAGEVFQECLIRAEHMQTPELIVRSYENLGELAVTSGDEAAARKWHAEAERVERG